MNSEWLQHTILRATSFLAPREERAEWVQEWLCELWYVQRRGAMLFCLGSFRDALWLRRNSPAKRTRNHLESPLSCLAFLAILAAVSLFIAVRLPSSPLRARDLPGACSVASLFAREFLRGTFSLRYKVLMKPTKYVFATTEMLLIFPAALFMAALFLRNVQPQQYEPAHTAQQIVTWYAGRPRIGLWGLLIALPLTVLVTGCATLWRRWRNEIELRQAARDTLAALRAHLAAVMIAGATLTAGGVLAIVALHVLTD